jgi:hypothetical protein
VTKEAANKKPWRKPELKRIGEIKQVAGPAGTGPQGTPLRS